MPMSTKRRAPVKVAAPAVKPSAKVPSKSTIDESFTSVAGPDPLQGFNPETIDISSDDESDDEDDFSDELDEDEDESHPNGNARPSPIEPSRPTTNGTHAPVNEVAAEEEDAEADAGATSPSFGELLRGKEVINVPALLPQSSATGLAVPGTAQNPITPPSHKSLGTVLSQALKSDDTDLLESCLHTTDLVTIRNTIEMLDSPLAGILLTKLAARLHRRPGRAGHLMTWVQWTLIAHGGTLSSQPKVIHSLSGLQKVLAERAKGLNSLLALKGKLDLLEGQMDLRRRMQKRSGLLQQGGDEEHEKNLVWVEGESGISRKGAMANGISPRRNFGGNEASDDSDGPAVDGLGLDGPSGDDSEEEDGESSREDDGASDAAEESLNEDDVDYNDVDESMGEDEESDGDAPPSKIQKTDGPASKRK